MIMQLIMHSLLVMNLLLAHLTMTSALWEAKIINNLRTGVLCSYLPKLAILTHHRCAMPSCSGFTDVQLYNITFINYLPLSLKTHIFRVKTSLQLYFIPRRETRGSYNKNYKLIHLNHSVVMLVTVPLT